MTKSQGMPPRLVIWIWDFLGPWNLVISVRSFQKPSPFQPNMFPFAMSLTNEQIEEQLLQLADALAQMSEMTATAFEQRDEDLKALKDKVAALEAKLGGGE